MRKFIDYPNNSTNRKKGIGRSPFPFWMAVDREERSDGQYACLFFVKILLKIWKYIDVLECSLYNEGVKV